MGFFADKNTFSVIGFNVPLALTPANRKSLWKLYFALRSNENYADHMGHMLLTSELQQNSANYRVHPISTFFYQT
jgi:hypothetical protein